MIYNQNDGGLKIHGKVYQVMPQEDPLDNRNIRCGWMTI